MAARVWMCQPATSMANTPRGIVNRMSNRAPLCGDVWMPLWYVSELARVWFSGTNVARSYSVPEFTVQSLLKTPTVVMHDVCCQGSHREQSGEECTTVTHVVFPYRGVYVRHVGQDQTVAEANQVLFFNTAEGYRVSHPVPGGDASLTLVIAESQLRELAPRALLRDGAGL